MNHTLSLRNYHPILCQALKSFTRLILNLEGNETGLTYQRFQCHLGKACTPKKGKNTSNEPLQTIKLEYIQKC